MYEFEEWYRDITNLFEEISNLELQKKTYLIPKGEDSEEGVVGSFIELANNLDDFDVFGGFKEQLAVKENTDLLVSKIKAFETEIDNFLAGPGNVADEAIAICSPEWRDITLSAKEIFTLLRCIRLSKASE